MNKVVLILTIALALSLLMIVGRFLIDGKIDANMMGLAGTIVTGAYALMHIPVKNNNILDKTVEVDNETQPTTPSGNSLLDSVTKSS